MGLFGPPNIQKMEVKRDVRGLIGALKYQDEKVRGDAAQALGNLADVRALEPLLAAFKDDSWRVKNAAADSLGRLGDVRAVEPLIAALHHKDAHVRDISAKALGTLGDIRAVEPLIGTLGDNEWFVQSSAVGALSKLKDARAMEVCLRTFWSLVRKNKVDLYVKQALVKFLEQTRPVELLLTAFQDDHPWVRANAAEFLDRIHWQPDNAVEAIAFQVNLGNFSGAASFGDLDVDTLIQVLQANKQSHKDTRIKIINALGDTLSAKAVETLITPLIDEDIDISKAASQALKKIGEPAVQSAIEYCVNALENYDSNGRWRAAQALGILEAWDGIKSLLNALRDSQPKVRECALGALEQIGDPGVGEAVIPLAQDDRFVTVRRKAWDLLNTLKIELPSGLLAKGLGDPDATIRFRVLSLLGKQKDEQSIAILIKMLNNPEYDFRHMAAEGLGTIGDKKAVPALLEAFQLEYQQLKAAEARGDGLSGQVQVSAPGTWADRYDTPYFRARFVLIAVIKAFGQIGDPRAVPPLGSILGPKCRDSGIWTEVVTALGEIGDPAAIPYLSLVLKHTDPVYRNLAAESISKIQEKASKE